MTAPLPLIPSTVCGSHGKAGWWYAAVKAFEAGQLGPGDMEEMFDDAAAPGGLPAGSRPRPARRRQHVRDVAQMGHERDRSPSTCATPAFFIAKRS